MKLIDGYDNYYIKEDGSIWNSKKNLILKPRVNKGYMQIILCKKSKHSTFKIHRLIAIAFIPNPDNKREINHIDGNKLNNNIDNLEWCTRSENNYHASRMGLKPNTLKKIETARKNGLKSIGPLTKFKPVRNIITGDVFATITAAAKSINIRSQSLSKKLNGVGKNNSDFIFV